MIWLRALSFILLVQVTFVGLIPWLLRGLGPRFPLGPWRIAGLLPLASGILLLLICNVLFVRQGRGTAAPYDPPRALVIRGPYRYVRNPMYVSATLIVAGLALWLQSVVLLGYTVILSAAYQVFVRYYEEPRLADRFGPAYSAYVRQVPRWLPALPGK